MIKKVKQLGIFSFNIAVGEVFVVMLADVTIAGTWKTGKVTDDSCCVTRYITDAVPVGSDYLDSIRIVWVCWFWNKVGNELAKVFVDIFAMGDACNRKLNIVYSLKAFILRPDADVVTFVFDAEISKVFDWYLISIG